MATHLRIFFTGKKSLAVGSGFFLLGFLFGNWATMIPYVKSVYHIDDGILGLILLCLPLGAMSFNPVAAIFIQKFGMEKVTAVGMVLLPLAYMLPLSLPYLWCVPAGLVIIGICMTLLNISVNTTATTLESTYKINIMSTCHGMFSIGLMIGSIMRNSTLMFGISESMHMNIMCIAGLLLSLTAFKTILSISKPPQMKNELASKFKLIIPKGALLTMVIISVCINVTEGSMADWASLYMKEIVRASPYNIGWGLFSYSALMATGRFFGDGIIPLYGKNKVLTLGALCAVCGITLTIVMPFTYTTVIGFGLVGLGVSCGAPILYASSARYPGIPDGGGLAIMNTFAMGGFLLGPVVIGLISEATALPVAFAFVAVLGIIWLVLSKAVKLY